MNLCRAAHCRFCELSKGARTESIISQIPESPTFPCPDCEVTRGLSGNETAALGIGQTAHDGEQIQPVRIERNRFSNLTTDGVELFSRAVPDQAVSSWRASVAGPLH
jgi:hypothetical protein